MCSKAPLLVTPGQKPISAIYSGEIKSKSKPSDEDIEEELPAKHYWVEEDSKRRCV